MMELKSSRLAIALALVAIICPSTFSAPATRSSCAAPVCRQSHDSKLHYQEGKTYNYGFETEVVTEVTGSTDETSKIKIKGQAVLAAQSSCDFVLTLQQVAIQSPSGEAISRIEDIEGSSLRFAYQNGEIESLCVSDEDPTWSANVKRAIASMLINKATKASDEKTETIEIDISGSCPTYYTVNGDKYTKTRDLNRCSHRDGGASVFYGIPYDVSSNFNSNPAVMSTLTCEQEITNGIFQSVSCVEKHQVAGLSTKSAGVQTQIKSSLTHSSTVDGLQKGARVATKHSSIFFDHAEIEEIQRQKTSASRAVDILNKLCQEVESGVVSSKVPGLFLQLRKAVKSARKDDLKQMYEQITSGRMCNKATEKLGKLYLDAAAMSGTDGAIAFVAEIIASDKAECHTTALFNMYTTFAARPGVVALQAAETLISGSEVDSKYILTASGLAHQYCKMTNHKCASNNEYISLVDKIAQHVRSASDEQGIKKVVSALQALGNLDQLTPSAVTTITNLLKDKSTSERLQVRALDAFRRNPCQDQLKQIAMKMFSHVTESSQVRIQAYLALTKCAQQKDIEAIQTVLDNEKSNQVASFVLSHIENVLESSSPAKKGIKNVCRQLNLENLQKNFSRDSRRFSRNVELSTFSPEVNLGGSIDGNLIFSQDSFLPRTTTANLTLDAFGRSYNMLEVGLYAEDFEHLLEKYLGPTGKVSTTSFEDLMNKGAEKWSAFSEGVKNRFKRAVNVEANQNEIDSIHQKVNIEERTGENGVGDVYIRVMGTSVLVESFSEENIKQTSLTGELKRGFAKMVDGAKDHNFDVTEPMMFLDDEVIVPTFSGLPLNLHLEGTTVLSIQMQGNLDIPALFRGQGLQDMRAKIIPSISTLLKAKMTVGAGPIESGIQLEGKIHSSSGVDLKIVQENKKFEVRFNIPQERTQVIDIRSDVYWIEQTPDSLEKKTSLKTKMASKSLVDKECMNVFSKVLGLKVCADVKVPQASMAAPFVLLNGPSVLSLTVEKSESSMEGYYLKVESDNEDNNFSVDVLLDTPGSKTNRKISASLQGLKYRSLTPEYKVKVDSPWTKLDVDYQRSFTNELKGFNLNVVSDGDAYNGKVQLKRTTAGDVNKYEPVVEYTLPGGKSVKLVEGQVVRVSGKKIEIDVRTAGPIRAARGSIKGSVEFPRRDQDGYQVVANNLVFSSEQAGQFIVDGAVAKTKNVFDTKVNFKYGQNAQHTLEVETTIGKPDENSCVLKAKTRSSRRSFLNIDLDWELVKESNLISHKLSYTRGSEEPKVHVSQKSKIHVESRNNFDIHHELTAKHPSLNIDFHTKAVAKASPGEARHAELDIQGKQLKANIRYDSLENVLDYTVKATADYSGKTYEFSEVSSKAAENTQNFKSRIAVNPGFWYEADTDIVHKFEKSDMESSISTTITSDRLSNPIVFKTEVKGKPNGYAAILKLDAKGKNYVDILTQYKYTKAAIPSTVTVKAFVLEYLDSKMTQTWGKGNGHLVVDAKWIPTGRKVTVNTDLSNQGDVYTLESDLKWDAERDQSKAASIKSITSLSTTQWQIDSTNDLTIVGRSSKISVKGTFMKELFNGEDNVELSYTSHEGKTYTVASVLNLENKKKVKAGKLNLKVAVPEKDPYEFTIENRVSNIDTQGLTFDAVTAITFDYQGQKDVKLRAEVSSALPGNFRAYAAKVEASGSVIPEPLSYELKADIKSGKWAVKGAGSRGTRKGDFDVTVDYDKWAPKKTLAVKYIVNTPFDRVKALQGDMKVGYLFNSWANFEYAEEGTFTLNEEQPTAWKASASVLNNELKFKSELKNENKQVFAISGNGKMTDKKTTTALETIYREDKSFVNIEIEHELPNVAFTVMGGSTVLRKGKDGTFELKVTHKKSEKDVYETDVLAKSLGELAFRVTNKLELSPQKKSIDLLIAAAEEPTRRVYFSVNEAESDKYNVEALLRWGDDGKFVHSKGEIVRSQEVFDANLTLDSPELNAKMLNVKLSKKSAGRQTLALKVEENNKEQFSAEFDFGKKEERSGMHVVYDGSLKVKGEHKKLMGIDFDGKFQLEDTTLNRQRDHEVGRKIRASVEIAREGAPMKFTGVAKTSDKEKQLKLSLCVSENECRIGDVHFKHQKESNGDLEYQLKVVGETVEGEAKSVTGASFRTAKSENGRQCEHVMKLILNNEKSEQVGYRLYRKDGNEFGAEILLPERVIASVLVGENPRVGDYKLEYSFYMDKTRQPNKKMSITFNTIDKQRSADHGFGREVELVLHHPDLKKDLMIKTKMNIGGEKTLLDLETVLDVFKSDSKITVAYKAFREQISEGHLYKGEWSVKSKGQNINFGGKSELKRADGHVTYKNVLHYENRDNQMKSAQIDADLSWNRVSVEVLDGEIKLVSFVSALEKHGSGFEYRQEYLLPGMEDARIFQTVVSTSSPKKIQAKTYTSTSATGVYYEAFIGFKHEDSFVAGLYDHEVEGKKILADFTVALNRSRILTVKADWDRKNIKNVVSKVQKRNEKIGENLKESTSSLVQEISKEVQFVSTNLRKASPNVNTLITNAKDRLAALIVELDAHHDTKLLLEKIRAVPTIMKPYAQVIIKMAKVARRIVVSAIYTLNEVYLETLPALLKEYVSKVPYTTEDLENCIEKIMQNLIVASRKTMKFAGDFVNTIVDSSPQIIERINWLLDISSDAGQCIRKFLEVALDEVANYWKAIRSLTNNILENSTVKMILKDIIATTEMMLSEFVEESKNHAENFKNYILQVIPQKEFHEVIELISDYVEKKARNQEVDDAAAIQEIYEKLVSVLKKVGKEIFTIDMKDGFFLAKIPVPVKSLSELVNIFDKMTIPSPPKVSFRLPTYSYGIRETINKFRNGASLDEIIPPFSAYGLLIGSQYYKTFDGQFFQFEGNCQYLLASDFDNGNFSVVVDYDNKGSTLKKSIIVTDQKDTVAIKPDSTVVVNGANVNVDSRVEVGSFVVERKGDWIVVTGAQGVKVGCAMSQDVCGVKVNGFYHGKVLGLLGKFNLEQFDDMSTPTGEIVKSANDLAKSWKIEDQCREQHVTSLPVVMDSVREKCAKAFGSSSSLRPCYKVVETTDYQSICERLSTAKGYDATRAVCTAASGYSKACRLSFAPVDTIEECRQV